MKKRLMKLLSLLLVCVMVVSALAACGNADPGNTPNTPTENKGNTADKGNTSDKGNEEKPATIEKITYLCSVGSYLNAAQELINEWNANEGKEKGVYIELISEIQNYKSVRDASLEAKTYYDLIHFGSNPVASVEKGYVKNLYTIEDEGLQAMIKQQTEDGLLVKNIHITGDTLTCLVGELNTFKLAINTDLFEKNNLDYPETWADIVECAKVITENGNGEEFGFGWGMWSNNFKRLIFMPSISSTGRSWWDPNTASYDFSIYETPVKALQTMYQNEWMMGADDLKIDPIRAQFSEGKVGMWIAHTYDYAVFTNQFPAKCNFTFIEIPLFSESTVAYKGGLVDSPYIGICAPAYDQSSAARQQAIVEAFKYLSGAEFWGALYAQSAALPANPAYTEGVEVTTETHAEAWAAFGDVGNYASIPGSPDSLLLLEGDSFEVVFDSVIHGTTSWDEAVADLNARYNAAFKDLVDSNLTDTSIFQYEYTRPLR